MICTDCGSPISPRRLAAVPDAERCVACQAAYDEVLVETDEPEVFVARSVVERYPRRALHTGYAVGAGYFRVRLQARAQC